MPRGDARELLLSGIDGSNPLGFLTAVGALRVLDDALSGPVRLGWRLHRGSWKPVLAGCGSDVGDICDAVLDELKKSPTTVFDIGKENRNGKNSNKFPFSHCRFARELKDGQKKALPSRRRDVDFLASFGTELYPDVKKDEFQETRFRMVRSGDSNKQGMLFYAKANLDAVKRSHIERALFDSWDYRDGGFGLRWDPIEDRDHALLWSDPSASGAADGSGVMLAANCLAVEALRCFPTFAIGEQARTTGFHCEGQAPCFVWPIWTPGVSVETLRSLLALSHLHERPLRRPSLLARGIEEVYCSRRIPQNKYYSNFEPARPLP